MRLVFAASCQRTRSSHRAPIEERGGGLHGTPFGYPDGHGDHVFWSSRESRWDWGGTLNKIQVDIKSRGFKGLRVG